MDDGLRGPVAVVSLAVSDRLRPMFDAIVADARDVRCQLTRLLCNVSVLALIVVFLHYQLCGARGV